MAIQVQRTGFKDAQGKSKLGPLGSPAKKANPQGHLEHGFEGSRDHCAGAAFLSQHRTQCLMQEDPE